MTAKGRSKARQTLEHPCLLAHQTCRCVVNHSDTHASLLHTTRHSPARPRSALHTHPRACPVPGRGGHMRLLLQLRLLHAKRNDELRLRQRIRYLRRLLPLQHLLLILKCNVQRRGCHHHYRCTCLAAIVWAEPRVDFRCFPRSGVPDHRMRVRSLLRVSPNVSGIHIPLAPTWLCDVRSCGRVRLRGAHAASRDVCLPCCLSLNLARVSCESTWIPCQLSVPARSRQLSTFVACPKFRRYRRKATRAGAATRVLKCCTDSLLWPHRGIFEARQLFG